MSARYAHAILWADDGHENLVAALDALDALAVELATVRL